jgi:hypothetical protein
MRLTGRGSDDPGMKPNAKSSARIVSCLAAGGLAIAGCGGSSHSGLTRSQIVAKANAICAAAVAAGSKIQQPSNFGDANAAAAYFNQIEPTTASATSKLAALTPDSGVKADWTAYITQRKAGLELLQTLQRKANAKDVSGLNDLKRVPQVEQQIVAAATKLGAKECAQ